jgi:6-phosphofructokinase 1
MRIAVLCSGGDSPGMNPGLRAIVRAAVSTGDEVLGITHGYEGLLNERFYLQPDGTIFMGLRAVSGLSNLGGTILHSSRSKRFSTMEGVQKGVEVLKKYHVEAVIALGGNGTLAGALDLTKVWDGQVIGLPCTIDNDLLGTDATIGFATAVNTVVEAVDKLHDTAGSHDMMFFVEVMGRHCGDIALRAAIASGSEIVCVPEIPTDIDEIIRHLWEINLSGKTSVLAIVAEGDDVGGAVALRQKLIDTGQCPYESRVVILGHIQRGGIPVPEDRILAATLGCRAIEALHSGETGKMVGLIHGKTTLTPLVDVIGKHRRVDPQMMNLLRIVAS